MGRYVFRKIKQHEVPEMFSLIRQRMKWMDEKGIRQWNVMEYDKVYPESYYEEERQKGQVYVLADPKTDGIVCAGVLKEEDERWEGHEAVPAFYVHNFASRVGVKGAGTAFLKALEGYAEKEGKVCLRLDSAEDNLPLARYYEKQGFFSAGICREGPYQGILREKKLQMDEE